MMSQDFRAEEGAWQGERSRRPSYQTYQTEGGVVKVGIRIKQIYDCLYIHILSDTASYQPTEQSRERVVCLEPKQ